MVTAELGACEWFVYELRRSNLIDRGQLDQVVGEFLKRNPRAEATALAQYLVEQGALSRFQAERVLTNKAQGLVLGPYVLVDAIGTGSMGTVYQAVSKSDEQRYAVKVLPRRSMWNVRLARRQVRSFSQFSHPAVVPFVDVGTAGGTHYLVWPLVEGETLESLVQSRSKLSAQQTALIGVQIANGIAACHGQGIFHGLLKPSNVMVGTNNQVAILDFGIGSLLAENEGESLVDTMSTANTLTSGLDCASPESIMEPTNRTTAGDQYSFGCTLYYCLAGRYPFPEGKAVEKMMAHQFKQPTPLKELLPDVPEKFVAIVERLMQKAPEARYSGMEEVVEELLPLVGGQPVPAGLHQPTASSASLTKDPGPMAPRPALLEKSAGLGQQLFPTPPPYPLPTGPAAPPPYATPGPAAPNLKLPTRQSLAPDEAPQGQEFRVPPGFVEESQTERPLGPLAFTILGILVMALSYMALLAFNPFK